MADVSAKTLPSGYSYEWTGTAYQEHEAGSKTGHDPRRSPCFSRFFSSSRSTRAG